jgi:hypothetical protein
MPVRPFYVKKYLIGGRLPPRSLYNLNLVLLHKIAILHNAIEPLDLESHIQNAITPRRIKRYAMMNTVNPKISDVSHPVGNLRSKQPPKFKVSFQIS